MLEVKGVIPPLITPIDKNERLDEAGLRRLINYVIEGGVHGIFVIGSTGEFYGLSIEDKTRAVEVAMEEVNGRVPVYVGASAITTKECIRLAQMAKSYEADAITVLTPMFISPNEKELYDHFAAIAKAVDIPNVIYNNPDRTGVNMSAAVVEKLADIDNIIAAKDTSGDMSLTAEYIRRNRGKDFSVMAGKDTLILSTLVYGGKGCVAGTANVLPKLVVEIYDKFMAGDLAGALDAQYRLTLFRNTYNLGSFPIVPKDALNILGVDVGHPIRPIQHVTEENQEKIRNILKEVGALKD